MTEMTELNFIDFKCPQCGALASFPEDCAGLPQECPSCSETVIVPNDGSEMGRAVPIPIKTPRLVLRRLHPNDWKDLLELMSDEALFEYVDGQPLSEEQILQWLDTDRHVKLTTPNQPFHLALELQEGGKMIGYVSLRLSDQHHLQASLHVFVNGQFQHQGFATEALRGTLDFCFRGIGLHRVTAFCDSRQTAACRLFEHAGLRREGEFRQDRFFNGAWVNTVWHAMLREEYRPA